MWIGIAVAVAISALAYLVILHRSMRREYPMIHADPTPSNDQNPPAREEAGGF